MHTVLLQAAAPLADSDAGKGSPVGFFVVLVLLIAVYFLYRSMSRHIRNLPSSFSKSDRPTRGDDQDPTP